MKTSRVRGLGVVALASLGCVVTSVGCATSTSDDASMNESAIRPMRADEILGTIAYGDTKEIEVTTSPKYRAYEFQGEKGDALELEVASLDGTDPIVWMTDGNFATIGSNNDMAVGNTTALLRVRALPRTGKYFMVFREMNFAPKAKFKVALRKTGSQPAACDPDEEGFVDPLCVDPIDPWDANVCTGTPLTPEEAQAKFGVAGGFRLTPPPTAPLSQTSRAYFRARHCNDAADPPCGDWVRAPLMDTILTVIQVPAGAEPNNFQVVASTSATGRKIKVDFGAGPAAIRQTCLDGPFENLRVTDGPAAWSAIEDPAVFGVCGTAQVGQAAVTATCARFEPAPVQVRVGDDPGAYVEYNAVFLARY